MIHRNLQDRPPTVITDADIADAVKVPLCIVKCYADGYSVSVAAQMINLERKQENQRRIDFLFDREAKVLAAGKEPVNIRVKLDRALDGPNLLTKGDVRRGYRILDNNSKALAVKCRRDEVMAIAQEVDGRLSENADLDEVGDMLDRWPTIELPYENFVGAMDVRQRAGIH